MEKIEEAIYFATKAHDGQRRKKEDILMIFHPLSVGIMLQKSGCEEDVVVAGILHDVIEDTKYTKEDIEERFGERVAYLVDAVSESDKSLPWEDRKVETIEYMRDASLEVKLISCADKISNLDSCLRVIALSGDSAWDGFKRGKEKQEWYYRSVYESILKNTDGKHPLFVRLGLLIEEVFV